MPPRTLSPRTALLTLLREIRYTLAQLVAHPLTVAHAPTFQALRDEWKAVLSTELEILEERATAQAAIDRADDDLDDIAGRTSRGVDDFAGENEKHPLRMHLFKGKSLSKFRRPILGGQLAAMQGWVAPLADSGAPPLVAISGDLVPLLKAANQAVTLQTDSTSKNRQFRDVGQRKQFIDKLNAKRKEVYGMLAKLPFEHAHLPPNFAERFFRVESADDETEETIEDVKAAIAELEVELAQRKAQLSTLEAAAAAAAKAAADKKAKELALEELEAQQAELAKKAAALKAQLGK